MRDLLEKEIYRTVKMIIIQIHEAKLDPKNMDYDFVIEEVMVTVGRIGWDNLKAAGAHEEDLRTFMSSIKTETAKFFPEFMI